MDLHQSETQQIIQDSKRKCIEWDLWLIPSNPAIERETIQCIMRTLYQKVACTTWPINPHLIRLSLRYWLTVPHLHPHNESPNFKIDTDNECDWNWRRNHYRRAETELRTRYECESDEYREWKHLIGKPWDDLSIWAIEHSERCDIKRTTRDE